MKSENTTATYTIVLMLLLLSMSIACAGCSDVQGFSLFDKSTNQSVNLDPNGKLQNNNDYLLEEADANKRLRDEVFTSLSKHDFGIIYEWGNNKDDYYVSTLDCVGDDGLPTHSMYPTFKCGDQVLCRKITDINQVSVGDVIVFRRPDDGGYSLHRVIQHNGDSVNTKGDNNKYTDPYDVNMSMDVSIVVAAFYTGYFGQDKDRDDISRFASSRLKYTYDYS